MEGKKIHLIFGIIKAILIFLFRLALLVPMVMLAVVTAMLGAGEKSIVEAFWTCVTHPFKALGEAIRNIKYEVDDYRS